MTHIFTQNHQTVDADQKLCEVLELNNESTFSFAFWLR